jgi:uncharacterized protein (DUF1800 family)
MSQPGDMPEAQRPLHALNRLGFGPRPGDVEAVRQMGVDRYVEQQLDPLSIAVPGAVSNRIDSLPTLRMTPVDLFLKFQQPIKEAMKGDPDAKKAARHEARQVMMEAVEARIVRAVYGARHLQEVLTAFWFNHFNVYAGKGLTTIWTGAFEEEAIRPNTMGRFRDLLGATAKHPAMLFYLDNWQNTAPDSPGKHGKFDGINENYAREVMELHTLGVNGGYSQNDVIALAHILTGWGLIKGGAGIAAMMNRPQNPARENFSARDFQPRPGGFFGLFGFRRPRPLNPHRQAARLNGIVGQYGFFFDASRHDFNEQTFLERTIAGGGIEQGEEALDMLARSPVTANHLSYEMAQYFVADNPPQPLVKRMASHYLATDGNIREVLAAMFTSGEFWDRRNYAVKFKTPYEYVISAVRVTNAPVINVLPLAGTMALLGMPLYGCQTPDGYKNTRDAWLNPDAMMTRLSFATALGAGRLPLQRPPDGEFGAVPGLRKSGEVRPVSFNGNIDPPDPAMLATTVGDMFSPHTASAVEEAPSQLRAPLILGSPEFMLR